MPKAFIYFLVFIIVSSCEDKGPSSAMVHNKEISKIPEDLSEFEDPIFQELMLFEDAYLFRGIDMNWTLEEVKNIELERKRCYEVYTEKDNTLLFKTQLGRNVNDFTSIEYTFDDLGLFFIMAEIHLNSKEKSESFYQSLQKYYAAFLSKGELADDGFLEYKGKMKHYNFLVSIKNDSINTAIDTNKMDLKTQLIYSIY